MQIAKFEEPIMKCVEMVVSELYALIHEATSKVRKMNFSTSAVVIFLSIILR